MSIAGVVAAMTWKPAAIAGIADRHGRTDRHRAPGATSSCSTPTTSWEVVPAKLASRSRNTPFAGRSCAAGSATRSSTGRPTVVDGVATDE